MTNKRKAKNSKVSREIMNCTCKVCEARRTVNFKEKIKIQTFDSLCGSILV